MNSQQNCAGTHRASVGGLLLRLDFTSSARTAVPPATEVGGRETRTIFQWDDAPRVIREETPCALCAEFEWPEPADLAPIGPLARQFPQLPIVVLSEGHSEALAMQALRMRAWDFLLKPIDGLTLSTRIESLVRQAAPCIEHAPDSGDTPTTARSPDECKSRTAVAAEYVASKFRDHVSLAAAADLCHLSVSQFSRLFRREHGQTFHHFVVTYRIRHACDLLSRAPVPVKQVGFDVGFSDLAYFSRTFRRYVGTSPTTFQSNAHKP